MRHEGSDLASTPPRRGKKRAPEEPSAEERARHEVTHLPYQLWCARCVVGKGRAKSHIQRPVESVKVPKFEMDFCYLLQDPKRRHQPGDQAWAMTLVMVDVAAQNPVCAALSTQSDQNACLLAWCTAFFQRMAYAKAVLKVDSEPALRASADKIALKASADGIQLQVETAPRFSSQSIGAVGRAQDAVESQIRCLRLELETRLSMEETPAMGMWQWLVRHAGWLLERYHVKGNKKTVFEDCFEKLYQGEFMKFAEVALFRVQDLSAGYGLARLGSDEHLFATDGGVYTTRTGETSSRHRATTARLVKSRLGGRPAGRPAQNGSPSSARRDTSCSHCKRPSDDASERRSAQAQDLIHQPQMFTYCTFQVGSWRKLIDSPTRPEGVGTRHSRRGEHAGGAPECGGEAHEG